MREIVAMTWNPASLLRFELREKTEYITVEKNYKSWRSDSRVSSLLRVSKST